MLMKNFHDVFFKTLLIGLLAVGFAGCDDDDDQVVEPVSVAYVSLYHAAPDAPPVDILMENRQINFYPLQYTRHTGYLNFFTGDRSMRVRPYNDANVIIDTTFTFEEGQAYSVFYVNRLADIQAMVIEDELVSPEAEEAAVRFVHLSPDAPEVDLVSLPGENGENGDGESSLADGTAYLEASDFMTVESGFHSFQVRAAGGDEVLLSIPDVNLMSGGVYTIVARGFQSPPAGNTNNLGAQILVNY